MEANRYNKNFVLLDMSSHICEISSEVEKISWTKIICFFPLPSTTQGKKEMWSNTELIGKSWNVLSHHLWHTLQSQLYFWGPCELWNQIQLNCFLCTLHFVTMVLYLKEGKIYQEMKKCHLGANSDIIETNITISKTQFLDPYVYIQ